MSLLATMQADLKFIEADLGDKVFTWQGEDYVCSPGSLNESFNLGIGGFGQNLTKVLLVRKNLFTDDIFPEAKQLLTYDSKQYRIATVVENTNKAFLRLVLSDDDKGV